MCKIIAVTVWYNNDCSGSVEGHNAYVIPAGGSSTLGTWGYIDAFSEMIQQVIIKYTYLFVEATIL